MFCFGDGKSHLALSWRRLAFALASHAQDTRKGFHNRKHAGTTMPRRRQVFRAPSPLRQGEPFLGAPSTSTPGDNKRSAGAFFLGGKPGAHGGGVFVGRPTLPFTLVPLLLRRSRGGSNTPQPGSECHDCLVLFDENCAAGAASERSEPTRQSMPDRHDAVSIWGPETRRQNGSAKAEAQQLGFGL
jgi:hypothetical protein